MPYIKIDERNAIDWGTAVAKTPGQLNYVLTKICLDFLRSRTQITKGYNNYQDYNDVIGALEGCKLELYARKVRPYEDTKIEENGDVW